MNIRKIAVAALVAAGIGAPHAVLAGTDPVYNWSGAYIGAFAGYGWGTTTTGDTHLYQDADGTDEFDDGSPVPGFAYDGKGAFGGAEAGYNWQAGNFVFGVVTDIGAANIKGTYTDSARAFTSESTINWLGTSRVNIGVPVGNALIYGTGGVAYGGITADLTDDYTELTGPVMHSTDKFSAVGWALGGGVAVAINPNWIFKTEYLYTDLGNHDVTFHEVPDGDFGFPLITSSARATASLLKFSVDYKF